jgi:uncharacterized protein (TIGR02118 family)
MAIKLVVLYTHPEDAEEFDRHYLGTHMPMVQQIPGLRRFESGRIVAALDGGKHDYYRIAELYFHDRPAMDAAFGSEQGKATAADYQRLAPEGSRMYVEVVDD